MRHSLALLLALFLASLVVPGAALGQFDDEPLATLSVRGSPFAAANDGAAIKATVTLREAAELRLRVTDFDGRTVRELFAGTRDPGSLARTWNGRDDDGDPVANGPYRLVATASANGRTERAAEWVAIADRKVYPRRPGFITVAVDPGHGGRLDGAVVKDGTREADLNRSAAAGSRTSSGF